MSAASVASARVGGLRAKCERRRSFGADVEGKQLQDGEWEQDRVPAEREDDEGHDLGRCVVEDVEQELADVLVDAATRLDVRARSSARAGGCVSSAQESGGRM